MSDLIGRQVAIDAVSKGCQELRGVFARCEKNLLALPPAQQWIPVSERLPEYKMQVLTIDKDGDYELNHIVDEEDGEWYRGHVIAWMPLPEPWRGEEP